MNQNDTQPLTLLDSAHYDVARPLFAELSAHHLFATAVLNHDLAGRIYVDDVKRPTSGFMSTKELQFLAGNPNNAAFNAALKAIWQETIFRGDAPGATLDEIDLTFMGETWLPQLEFLMGDWRWPPIRERAYHYCLTAKTVDWQAIVPSGYSVKAVDGTTFAPQIEGQVFNVQSPDYFTARDFGFCAVGNGRIVCLCATDVISGTACEIGIETHADHYRRGLATATAAATVEYALGQGFEEIWWICSEQNLGSIRTAEKVGFTKQFETDSYFFILDEMEHKRQINHES